MMRENVMRVNVSRETPRGNSNPLILKNVLNTSIDRQVSRETATNLSGIAVESICSGSIINKIRFM